MYLHEIGRFLTPGALIICGARMVSLPDPDDPDNPAAGFSDANLAAREAEQLARIEAAGVAAAAVKGTP